MTLTPEPVNVLQQNLQPGDWLGRPLRTLRQAAFDAACAELMRRAEAGFAPTLMVGIRSGGLIVARSMAQAARTDVAVLAVTSRRVSTRMKTRMPLLRGMLRGLPVPARNLLRRVEHRWLIERRARRPRQQWVDRAEAEAVAVHLRDLPSPARVLVVDDAVDSGATLAAVMQTLQEVCPFGTVFRTAAITQTLADPALAPDIALYVGVLCRFPWSFDADA